jgi:3D (Asp-Asp-Asp) domain-containing protein
MIAELEKKSRKNIASFSQKVGKTVDKRPKKCYTTAPLLNAAIFFLKKSSMNSTLRALKTKSHEILRVSIALVLLVSVGFTTAAEARQGADTALADAGIRLEVEKMQNTFKSHGLLPESDYRAPERQMTMPVTAYNSVPWQTDDTPCIGAQNTDICEIYARGENVCAANFVPLGTILEVEGLGTCVVRDRMNARYHYRVDWYMGMDIDGARAHGIRTKTVGIY